MFQRHAPPALSLDFVARRRAPSLTGWLILLAGLLALSASALEYGDLAERKDDAEHAYEREARLQKRDAGELAARSKERIPAETLVHAARIAQALRRPWAESLPQLEAAGSEDVAMLTLDTDADKGSLRVTGEARSLEAVFDYARRIGEQPAFASVQVENYEFREKTGVRSVQFRLVARWRGIE